MVYFLTIWVSLLSLFLMSCSYYNGNVGYGFTEDIPISGEKLKNFKKSKKSVRCYCVEENEIGLAPAIPAPLISDPLVPVHPIFVLVPPIMAAPIVPIIPVVQPLIVQPLPQPPPPPQFPIVAVQPVAPHLPPPPTFQGDLGVLPQNIVDELEPNNHGPNLDDILAYLVQIFQDPVDDLSLKYVGHRAIHRLMPTQNGLAKHIVEIGQSIPQGYEDHMVSLYKTLLGNAAPANIDIHLDSYKKISDSNTRLAGTMRLTTGDYTLEVNLGTFDADHNGNPKKNPNCNIPGFLKGSHYCFIENDSMVVESGGEFVSSQILSGHASVTLYETAADPAHFIIIPNNKIMKFFKDLGFRIL